MLTNIRLALVALSLLLIGGIQGAGATPPSTLFGSVAVCDPNSPQTCSSPGVAEFDVSLTPAITAGAYSTGNAIGALQTIPAFRVAGGTAILNNVSVWSKAGATNPLTLYIFKGNPSASTCNGATAGNAFVLGAADVSKLVASIPVVLTPAVVGAGTTATTASSQIPVAVKNADSTVNLYACAVVGAPGFTPSSTTDLVLTFSGAQD